MVIVRIPETTKKEWIKLIISSLTLAIFIIWSLFYHLAAKTGIWIFSLLVLGATVNTMFVLTRILAIRDIKRKEEDLLLGAIKDFFKKRGIKF